jgi:signal transduction histidine kinase
MQAAPVSPDRGTFGDAAGTCQNLSVRHPKQALLNPHVRAIAHKVWLFLRGPRTVDFPIRVAIFSESIFFALPDRGAESDDLLYVVLRSALPLFMVLAAFCPTATVIFSTLGYIISVVVYPGFLCSYDMPLSLAVVVFASRGRWVWTAIATAVILALYQFAAVRGNPEFEGRIDMYSIVTALLFVVAGWVAWYMDKRIIELIRINREEAAGHAQQIADMKLGIAIDTHDTFSHVLSAQAAMIRELAAGDTKAVDPRLLTELSMITARGRQQLSQMLTTLKEGDTVHDQPAQLRAEVHTALASIASVTRTAGFSVQISTGTIPEYCSTPFAQAVIFMIHELATNTVKHAADHERCLISVGLDDSAGRHVLRLESGNPTTQSEAVQPYTLAQRATSWNGVCSAWVEPGGLFRVRIDLPVPRNDNEMSPEQGTSGKPIRAQMDSCA